MKWAAWIRSRRLQRWLLALGAGVLLWLAISVLIAHKLTRRRRAPFPEPAPRVAWGAFEDGRLETSDGQELGAWFLRGDDTAPSVLLLHGNGGSRTKCLNRAELYANRGYSVLLISLRAHGDSSGDFNDIGYSARHDVIRAVEYLEQQRPGRPVLIHGTSMGAAAALFAAADLGDRVRAYVLESLYRDLRTAVWNRVDNALPPLLDSLAYGGLSLVAPLILPEIDRISPIEAIGNIPEHVPILMLAGEEDRRARPEEAIALQRRARDHCQLILFERTDHLRFLDTQPERYRKEVLGFVERVFTPPA
jgi:alpha-beta hydrolase superfamily lysophospholipase